MNCSETAGIALDDGASLPPLSAPPSHTCTSRLYVVFLMADIFADMLVAARSARKVRLLAVQNVLSFAFVCMQPVSVGIYKARWMAQLGKVLRRGIL